MLVFRFHALTFPHEYLPRNAVINSLSHQQRTRNDKESAMCIQTWPWVIPAEGKVTLYQTLDTSRQNYVSN